MGLLKSLSGKASLSVCRPIRRVPIRSGNSYFRTMPGFQLRCRAGAEVGASCGQRPRELSLFPSEGGLGEHPAEDRVDGSHTEPAQSQVQTLPSAPNYSNLRKN